MDIQSLRYAVTLADELHFGRAAARHYIAAQPFGQRIRRLERELGTPLFARTSRHVELTPAGERVVQRARTLLVALDRLAEEAAAGPPGDGRPLRIGVLGFGVAERWSDLHGAVARQLPELSLVHAELDLESQYAAVRSGQVDVAIVHDVGPVDGLDMTAVMSVPRVAVVPAGSDLADAEWLRPDDLADRPSIRLPGAHPGMATWMGASGGPLRNSPVVLNPATISAAVATTGVISLHGEAAKHFYPRPDVRFVPVEGPPCDIAVATRAADVRAGVEAFRRAARLVATLVSSPGRNRFGT